MSDPLIGLQLDEYRLDSLLGQGGMARVYRGLDTGLHRYAAIKVIDTPYQEDEGYIERFEREARAIAALDHPHIVTVYRYGRADHLLYLAMKYIEGADLHTILTGYEQDGQLMPTPEVVRLLREMGSALDYAHSRGVVHRDVKPSNVMVDGQGRSYITDFGLALLADVGTRGEILGSPHYIAPEQAVSSAGAVPQSDLYALGVILFRMVTGQLPFAHDDLLELLMQHMTAVPPAPRTIRPEISPGLEAVMLRALAKEPAERFQSGQALADAVAGALAETNVMPVAAVPTLTIVDRVALDKETLPPLLAATPPRPTPSPTAPAPVTTAPSRFVLSPSMIGGALVLLVLVAAALFLFRGRADSGDGTTVTDVTAVAIQPTAEVVSVVLPGDSGDAEIVVTTAVTSTLSDPAPGAATAVPIEPIVPAAGGVYLPIISAAQPVPPTPTETATSAALSTSVPTQPPAPTPPTAASIYMLVFEQKEDTLFMTNAGDSSLALAGLEIATGRNGRQRFADWGLSLLPPGNCVHMSKKAKDATANTNGTTCIQLDGDLLLYDWKEEFALWYNGQEVQACNLDDEEHRCVIIWQP